MRRQPLKKMPDSFRYSGIARPFLGSLINGKRSSELALAVNCTGRGLPEVWEKIEKSKRRMRSTTLQKRVLPKVVHNAYLTGVCTPSQPEGPMIMRRPLHQKFGFRLGQMQYQFPENSRAEQLVTL